jgi:DNA-binding CsgD family transcriptional regulator
MKRKKVQKSSFATLEKRAIPLPTLFNYEHLLNEIHPDFCRHLLERATNLTRMEILNCMLARLHLSVKEAAVALAVTPSSVLSHRSSARKKLKMGHSQSLSSILQSLP